MQVETVLYSIESHGVDSEQCFPGAGTACTPFDAVVTGIGDTEAEAYEDAVEQIAMGYDDELVEKLDLPNFWGDDESTICSECRCNGEAANCSEECEFHYYVSVYFNIKGKGRR